MFSKGLKLFKQSDDKMFTTMLGAAYKKAFKQFKWKLLQSDKWWRRLKLRKLLLFLSGIYASNYSLWLCKRFPSLKEQFIMTWTSTSSCSAFYFAPFSSSFAQMCFLLLKTFTFQLEACVAHNTTKKLLVNNTTKKHNSSFQKCTSSLWIQFIW